MNKEEARKRLEEIKQEEEELQAIIDKPDRWQDGLVQPDKERYFYLLDTADEGLAVCGGSKSKRKPEYAFRTKEQAELIKEKALLMQEMHAFAHVKNEGWMPDWEDEWEKKFGITASRNKACVDHFFQTNQLVFGVAVKSKAIAVEMIETFGERIEKFYDKMY